MDVSRETCTDHLKGRTRPLKGRKDKNSILLNELFVSIQGESSWAGLPCVFIRTTACHLRCTYCDTRYAFFEGSEVSIDDILRQVESYSVPLVEVTGGEPLLQKTVFSLLSKLCEWNYTVLLETSGAVSIEPVDRRVHVILDVKTPGSGEASRNLWSNFDRLWPGCEVKFVITNREDFDYAKTVIKKYELSRYPILFSPKSGDLQPAMLCKWILEEKLLVRFQLQQHKIIWGDKRGV